MNLSTLPATLGTLPDGVDGIRRTLSIMRALARKFRADPQIILLAREVTDPLPPKNYYAEIKALFQWVKDHIRYVRDVRDTETVATPVATLQIGSGDCDDMSLLLSALLESIGVRTRFAALGFPPDNNYSHVLVEAQVGPKHWMPLDAIVAGSTPGWYPPNVSRKMVLHV